MLTLALTSSLKDNSSHWSAFKAKDGSFTVSFPTPPQLLTRDENILGLKLTFKGAGSYTAAGGFLVLYCDFPKQSKAQSLSKSMFAGACAKIEESGKFKMTQQTDFKFGTYPGKMIVLEGANDLAIKDFLIVAGDRFYQVMAATNTSKLKDPALDQFFNSFSIK